MKQDAIRIATMSGQGNEVRDAAQEIIDTIQKAGLKFGITACALLGMFIEGCGAKINTESPKTPDANDNP